MVPLIETARLRLREICEADLDHHAPLLGDPEFVRFLGGATLSREETWRKMLAGRAVWEILGYGYWSVERREDGAYVGQLGFADFKRDMIPSIEGAPEAGWLIAPRAQKQGYASEAMRAALRWADEHLSFQEITAIISHENQASIGLAAKLGFDRSEEASYKGAPILLFRRTRGSAEDLVPVAI